MANNLIVRGAARLIRSPKATDQNSVIINGNVYALYSWDMIEREARKPGTAVMYHRTECRLSDDGTELLFRIFSITHTGSFAAIQAAVMA